MTEIPLITVPADTEKLRWLTGRDAATGEPLSPPCAEHVRQAGSLGDCLVRVNVRYERGAVSDMQASRGCQQHTIIGIIAGQHLPLCELDVAHADPEHICMSVLLTDIAIGGGHRRHHRADELNNAAARERVSCIGHEGGAEDHVVES